MSYKEEDWVTLESFQSIFSNLMDIPCKVTLVISTGTDKDDLFFEQVYQAHPSHKKVNLILQRQTQGKRIALGDALRAVARRYNNSPEIGSNSVTVLMDGDTYLPAYVLKETIPFFSAFRELGALTTNETAYINTASHWYKDWFHLKFGQRHTLFQSHSLSHKVLTLTGRFSMFRTGIVIEEAFICQIENDVLDHWLYGKFRFLMGDDKSSWYHLLAKGWKMLYVPDTSIISLESRDGDFIEVSRTLPYRWSGNTLRNNARALMLGPHKTGWFIWYAILDQRLTMWTGLVGLISASILAFTISFVYLPLYIAWIIAVRVLQMSVIAMRGHPVSMRTIPLMLYNQWLGSLIKIHAYYHLSSQKWAKSGTTQSNKIDFLKTRYRLARILPDTIMILAVSVFIFIMMMATTNLRFPVIDLFASETSRPVFLAEVYGITPNDQADDAYPLQQLLHWIPDGSIVRLPAGQLDFFEPLVIERSFIRLEADSDTEIVSHIDTADRAIIELTGKLLPTTYKLASAIHTNDTELSLTSPIDLPANTLIQLRAPNSEAYFDSIGSLNFRKQYPWIRQSIVKVKQQSGSTIQLKHATGLTFPAQTTQLRLIQPVTGVELSGFKLSQRIPGQKTQQLASVYENIFPAYAIDGIHMFYAENCLLDDLVIQHAGRHPVHLESSYGNTLRALEIDGAWNKGKGGNGYLRISRSYHNQLQDSQIHNIRHITIQWSSAYNVLSNLSTNVDINLHGGYSHHNKIDSIHFTASHGYKWHAVTRTPENATWAPPDGPDNIISNIEKIENGTP